MKIDPCYTHLSSNFHHAIASIYVTQVHVTRPNFYVQLTIIRTIIISPLFILLNFDNHLCRYVRYYFIAMEEESCVIIIEKLRFLFDLMYIRW